MESPLGLATVHWDHEPVRIPPQPPFGHLLPHWGGNLFSRVGTALHWTANRPGSQRVVRPEDIALFQSASACPRAADGDRPRSALTRPDLAKQIPCRQIDRRKALPARAGST